MVFAIIAQINKRLQPPYTVAGAIGPAPEHRQRRWAPFWLGPPGWCASPADRSRPAAGALWLWSLLYRLACTVHLAQGPDRPDDTLLAFTFADGFSRKHRINPAALLERLVAQDAPAVVDTAPHENCTAVSILESPDGCERPGGVLPSTLHVQGMPRGCPSPPADAQAVALANAFHACILPQASGDPWSLAPPHRSQDNAVNTQNGSFSDTPLTAYTLTARGRASSVFGGPRFQGRNITTQGGPQQ